MRHRFFVLLIIIVLLAACSSDQAETALPELLTKTPKPTSTPVDTTTPTLTKTTTPSFTPAPTESSTPTQSASSSPDPVNTNNWQEYNSQLDPNRTGLSETNFSVKYPFDWDTGWDEYGGYSFFLTSGDIDADDLSEIYAQHNVIIGPDLFRYPPKVNTLYDWRNDMVIVTEPYAIKINGQDAAKAIFKSDDFVLLVGWIVKDDANIFFGAIPSLEENIDALPLLETILNSIHFTEISLPSTIPTLSGIDQEVTDDLEHILITEEYLQTLLDDDWELTFLKKPESFWLMGSEKPGICKRFSSKSQSIFTCWHSVSSEDPVSLGDVTELIPEDWINIPSNKSYPHDVAFYGVLDDSNWVIHGYMAVEEESGGLLGLDLFFVEFDGIQIDEGLPIEDTLTRYVDDYVGEILLYNMEKYTE